MREGRPKNMSETPQVVDRFEISRILGKGGMGTVYLARDQRLGRQVAVKVLNTDENISDEARARFLREARTAGSIRQQNVATIYEVGETAEGQPFLVMEYCEGETLAQRLRRRPLEAGEFLSIARQIAAGMTAAHTTGVIHRDLKTANIIIEPSGIVKILDFGLARLLSREAGMSPGKPSYATTSGQFFGTLHFLAPEQARGQQADERSDLFAIGVIFYQMATGQLPFNADSPLLVLEKIRDSEPEPFVPVDPAFPPAAAKIVSRLLQKFPADRYPNASTLLHDLEAIEAPTARQTGHHSRSMLGATRHQNAWIRPLIAIAALVIVGIAVYLVQHNRGTESAAAPPAAVVQSPIRSMAVLPFSNIANSTRDDFLSVGLADALVTKLQAIPSLQVRPTSAVLQFRNQKVDAKVASEKLQVDGVLEGHFLSAGDLVRVNLQLTDLRSGYGVWADSVDGKRDNLLKLIDDVSARTVTGLNERLAINGAPVKSHSEPRSSNPQAFEQYLKARALTGSFSQKDYNEQIVALKKAIDLDPSFAAAYADLAIALSLGSARSMGGEQDAIQKAEFYARQAVRLDPNLPQAHLALGRVFVRFPDRFRESVREVLAALRLNAADTQALNSVATYFVTTGDMQKAECIGNKIVALDPSSNEAKVRGYWYVNAVDPEGALQASKFALASPDTALAGHDIRASAFILLGNLVDAQKETDAAIALFPKHYLGKSLKAMIAAAKGDRAGAEAAIQSFETDASRNHWAANRVALCYAKLGDHDKAMLWMKKSFDLGHHSWNEMIKHPWLQSLQSDPEYQKLIAKIRADIDDVRDDVIGVYQLICK
jgi:serine/threonine protein kinase/tetratricopeptide (TPR) repeat protein